MGSDTTCRRISSACCLSVLPRDLRVSAWSEGGLELGGKAAHLRVVGVGRPVPPLVEAEPADALELPPVGVEMCLLPCHIEHEPQVNVEMAVRSPGWRDGQEERLVVGELRRDPQFLARLAD